MIEQPQHALPHLRRRIGLVLVALAVFALGAVWWWHQHGAAALPLDQPTLVVLPLHLTRAPAGDDALAEGLSVELIPQLARIQGLRVIASTSALRAAAAHLDDSELRERLGATHVLRGELSESDDRLHLDLRLIDSGSRGVVHEQVFDGRLTDLAALEHQIVQTVATALTLPLAEASTVAAAPNPQHLRAYFEARRLVNGQQRNRGLDLLRELTMQAPDYARAHATLARAITSNVRAGTSGDFDEAGREAARAQELDDSLAETQTALAILACRAADWTHCIDVFKRGLALDPSDAEARNTYAYWLAALGYVDVALRQAEIAWRGDPLSYNANFSYARLLDTAGHHAEATRYLDALNSESGGLIYARWHNAVWRHDYKTAARLTAEMPRSDGFRESYIVVSEALAEPRLWPQVQPLISTSERANGGINVQRIMMPNPDYAIVLTGLEKMLRDGWPSYYMLLWMPEYAPMRRDPAFQDFLKRTGLLAYWRDHGFPAQCRADGDGAICN